MDERVDRYSAQLILVYIDLRFHGLYENLVLEFVTYLYLFCWKQLGFFDLYGATLKPSPMVMNDHGNYL